MTSDKHNQHHTQPLLSQFSTRKKENSGGGGAYFKFWPIVGALIRRECLFEGGKALNQGFTIYKYKLN